MPWVRGGLVERLGVTAVRKERREGGGAIGE